MDVATSSFQEKPLVHAANMVVNRLIVAHVGAVGVKDQEAHAAIIALGRRPIVLKVTTPIRASKSRTIGVLRSRTTERT